MQRNFMAHGHHAGGDICVFTDPREMESEEENKELKYLDLNEDDDGYYLGEPN